jgi:DNA-binding XRE family transcriptional regulator
VRTTLSPVYDATGGFTRSERMLMRSFAVSVEDSLIGEAVQFSNGNVVVRWLNGDTISRFLDMNSLRDALQGPYSFDPIRVEPMAVRLRRARAEAGLSQRGLSREIGVSFSTISRIEAGRKYVANPTIETWLENR